MSVGPDEVVVTFTTRARRRACTTRVGDHEVDDRPARTTSRASTGLEPDTEYDARGRGRRARRLAARRRCARCAQPPGGCSRRSPPPTTCTSARPSAGAPAIPPPTRSARSCARAPGEPPYPEVMNGARRRRDARARSRRGGREGRPHRHRAARGVRGVPRRVRRARRPACTTCAATTTRCATRRWRVEGAPYAVELDGVTLAVLDTVDPGHGRRACSPPTQLRLARRPRRRRRPARCSCSATTPSGTSTRAVRSTRTTCIARDDSEALVAVVARRENIVGYFAGHTHRNRVRALRAGARRAVRRGRVHQGLPGRVGRVPRATRAATRR